MTMRTEDAIRPLPLPAMIPLLVVRGIGPRSENGCGQMRFLIKSAFWLSLVLLVIPFGGENDEPTVGAIEAFFAARAVIDDMSGLCERRPYACEIGRSAFHTISIRARDGARLVYEMLGEERQDTETSDIEVVVEAETPIHTGSVPAPAPALGPVPVPTARDVAPRE